MTPQERQLVDDLFDRLSKLRNAPRDPDAIAAISDGLRKAPGAVYALVQTTLLQDEALKRAHDRIQELEAAHATEQPQSGGFLDTMRDTLFGGGRPRGSVPNVPPRDARPVWNSGQVMQQAQPGYGSAAALWSGLRTKPRLRPRPYGAPQPVGGGGGSFLGTAAAAAAGVVGGSLLLGSIRGMMGGGSHQAFGDTRHHRERGGGGPGAAINPETALARDAGLNDIGSNRDSRQGQFDRTIATGSVRPGLRQRRYDGNGRTSPTASISAAETGDSDYA